MGADPARGGPGTQAVAVLEPLHVEAMELLRRTVEVRCGVGVAVAGAAAIVTRGLGRVSAGTMEAAGPRLRCVARVGAGTDNIDVAAATRAGLPVFYAPDAFTEATAEHALTLMLAVARRVPFLDGRVRAGDWAARVGPLGLDLGGRRLGIIGLGRIGRRFAELGRALGMEVVAWSRAARDDRFPHTDLDRLLATSDVVSLHLPLSPETAGFLSRERIARMRRGAIVVNVSRGGLVDEDALGAALAAGRLRGAGLDVLAREPPPPGHALYRLPQVVLTPHSAALTEAAFRRACAEVVGAVLDHLAGRPAPGRLLRNPEVLRTDGTRGAGSAPGAGP